MKIKWKNLLFLSILLTLIGIIINNSTIAAQINNCLEEEKLILDLWYDGQPHLTEMTSIECYIYSNGDNAVIFSLEFYIENSTHSLLLNFNSSVYLEKYNNNPSSNYYYYHYSLMFNKTESWEIWLNITTTTGNVYYQHGWLEVSPFELSIYHHDNYAYVNDPAKYYLKVEYYDYGTRNINVEVMLDNYIYNTSIYSNYAVPQFSGISPPEYWYDSFNNTFSATGSYRLWLVVYDYDESKEWISAYCPTNVQWVEIKISAPDDVFIENSTTINFEIYSSVPQLITLDIYLYITGGFYYAPFNQTFYTNTITLNGTTQKVNYTDSITINQFNFSSWGNHCHDIVVKAFDSANDEESQSSFQFYVHEKIEIYLNHPNEIWLYDYNGYEKTISIYFEINYMGTKEINISIELLLDDGNSNTTLYYNNSHSYDGVTPYSFEHDWTNTFYEEFDHTFSEPGYYDTWVKVSVNETEDMLNYGHLWLQVYKEDKQAPKFLDISGLDDEATYSGIITVSIWLEDETGVENVKLQMKNENYSGSVYFEEVSETEEYYEAQLQLDTSKTYDGYYIITIIAEDVLGNSGSVLQINIYLENGNIYTRPDTIDKNEEDKITSGFEYLLFVTAFSFWFLLKKIRKAD